MAAKVLVANRGEIAIRILRSARELGWSTVAVYLSNDASHAGYADEAVKLESVGDFMNVEVIAATASRAKCTHVHPGYGFLSENPELSQALSKCAPAITFVGPSPDTLRIASDKMLSRELATALKVNIAPGRRVSSSQDVLAFGQQVGYPVMIKALDGGGGRGIRVVSRAEEVDEAFKRCLGESPSKQVFVEKALTGPGWKHIEVQVIGDGTGGVNHLWERECSVQRRFQKIVETAPSRLPRSGVQPLINASLSLAVKLLYKGLGTFEFLVNSRTGEWVFLEINPRVQVEHTVTEEVVDLDLVRAQLLLFTPNVSLQTLSLDQPLPPPTDFAVQLRLTAEDPSKNFQLSPGTIRAADLTWPAGRGVRIDTWLSSNGHGPAEWTVGTEFDSLLAKFVVRGRSFEEVTQKARRVVREFNLINTNPGSGSGMSAVRTNAAVLAGVLEHPDWLAGDIDTLWLERNAAMILDLGNTAVGKRVAPRGLEFAPAGNSSSTGPAAGGGGGGGGATITLLQPGSLFTLTLSPPDQKELETKHTLTLSSIGRNTFPEILSGVLQTTLSPSTPQLAFKLEQSTSAAVGSGGGEFELADPNDARHVGVPLTGKVVEVHSALLFLQKAGSSNSTKDRERLRVRKGEALVVLSVMKMENSVVAPFDGFVERPGKGVKVGAVVGEGTLACVLEDRNVVRTAPREYTEHATTLSAAELAWTAEYQGDADKALWAYLARLYCDFRLASYSCMVQSSGTGKSRTVDEMSKAHFVIPIKLEDGRKSGYPPVDRELSLFLTSSHMWTQTEVNYSKFFRAFLQALFETTALVLKNELDLHSHLEPFEDDDTPERIASKFRERMSSDVPIEGHRSYRTCFYNVVIAATEEITASKEFKAQTAFPMAPLERAFEEVAQRLRSGNSDSPLVVIAFDEAQALTDPIYYRADWSRLTVLQRVFSIRSLSLFTLFVSSNGNIDQLSRAYRSDGPWFAPRNLVGPPFVTLGFDQFAKLNGTEDLELVTSFDTIARFGRPLSATLSCSKIPLGHDLKLMYGALKLLNIPFDDIPNLKKLNPAQILACLSRWLPIGLTWNDEAVEQVDAHMRICLKADQLHGFENIVTIASSEPFLSETAYYIMAGMRMDCPKAYMDTMARDAAVLRTSGQEIYAGHGRWCTVPDFLEELFRPGLEKIHSAYGLVLDADSQGSHCKPHPVPLKETFGIDTAVYCTHFLKLHQSQVVNTKYLVRLYARGAGVLCPNPYCGIDGAIPYLYNSTKLAASNIGAILWRSTTDKEYGVTPQSALDLFWEMDPYETGLFNVDDKEPVEVPIIRIVFALGAETPSITIIDHGKPGKKKFTTYDIWVAGLGPEVFGVVDADSAPVWQALLRGKDERLRFAVSKEGEEILKSMTPGVAEDEAHWNSWVCEDGASESD
ncbi:hypothetical protein EST38_g3634 [Candolleomyces aberdarensis]|uniref:Pyruvate carboxylase n=1 Tax=Candolleomyces aberdarensis TaxID=2316362 RepID=A0A4Q2DQ27_9AGAR|nr:hypothetical protein EST38_g3634 [Candolleomyces aberdarensis]